MTLDGNLFIDSGGIRVKEANTIFAYNNYFERAGLGGKMDAVTYDFVAGNLQNINFIHNTFVECARINLSSGATNNTWANNLFSGGSGNIFAGSADGISWVGNLYSGNLGVDIASGMTPAAPDASALTLNAAGYYGLSASSVAIDQGSPFPAIYAISGVDGDYTVALNTSGQLRDDLKDVGADEYGATGPAVNRPLTLSDVGPAYLGGPRVSAASAPIMRHRLSKE